MEPEKSFYRRYESLILGGGSVAIAIGIWQAMWSAGKISPLFMSGPSAIAARFWEDLTQGSLGAEIGRAHV